MSTPNRKQIIEEHINLLMSCTKAALDKEAGRLNISQRSRFTKDGLAYRIAQRWTDHSAGVCFFPENR